MCHEVRRIGRTAAEAAKWRKIYDIGYWKPVRLKVCSKHSDTVANSALWLTASYLLFEQISGHWAALPAAITTTSTFCTLAAITLVSVVTFSFFNHRPLQNNDLFKLSSPPTCRRRLSSVLSKFSYKKIILVGCHPWMVSPGAVRPPPLSDATGFA